MEGKKKKERKKRGNHNNNNHTVSLCAFVKNSRQNSRSVRIVSRSSFLFFPFFSFGFLSRKMPSRNDYIKQTQYIYL